MKALRLRPVFAATLCLLLAPGLSPALRADETGTAPARTSPRPTASDDAVLEVLRSGDAAALKSALERGAPVTVRDAHGNTALMLAAVYGGVANLKLLLDHGADVNATNVAGATALMRAATDPAKVELLLRRGAAVDVRSASGNTALLLAARPAHSHRGVKLLLDHGANANTSNHFGATPLMAATAGGDRETVRELLRRGANPNARPSLDQPGFLFGGGRSPLMWAAFRGDLDMLKTLLEAGADVNLPGLLGTALAQAAWGNHQEAAAFLLVRGARPEIRGFVDGYTPLHWAASSEHADPGLLRLLLQHGADPNLGGGENVDAFLDTPQTPLMLARRRGDTALVHALLEAGATKATPDRVRQVEQHRRDLPGVLEPGVLREAVGQAVIPLQATALASKSAFLKHGSHQDCTSCHQQHLPMAAVGHARRFEAAVNVADQEALVRLVQEGEIKDPEIDLQPLFHPDPVMSKGYELLAYDAERLPADANSQAWVHHLASIQGVDGQWHNNLPRPPIQTSDIGATALAIHALQRYPLPGRRTELAERVDRARQWLWKAKAEDLDSHAYQLLGLAWAGESPSALRPLTEALRGQQRPDGGWAQLEKLSSDAYATGQAIYALRVASGLARSDATVDRGLRFLLNTQLTDGTWYVRRRAFPFQPTMDSGFPHGRDSWISAAATSWAVMAMSLPDAPSRPRMQALRR